MAKYHYKNSNVLMKGKKKKLIRVMNINEDERFEALKMNN